MRIIFAALLAGTLFAAAPTAQAQPAQPQPAQPQPAQPQPEQPQAPGKPRVYALLSAVGNRFTVVHEEMSVGSNLPPYRRNTFEVAGNLVNRLVLQSLDKSLGALDPGSRRIYLSTNPRRARGRFASEAPAIEPLLDELRKLDRAQWDRLVIATPGYRYQAKDGLAPRLQGMGIFAQPLCQSDVWSCDHAMRPPSGPQALTPRGDVIAANTYLAPFSFIELWVVDPKTLAVLDRAESYTHVKLTDPHADALGVLGKHGDAFVSQQLVETIRISVGEAVEASGLRGLVEVQEKGPVGFPPTRE